MRIVPDQWAFDQGVIATHYTMLWSTNKPSYQLPTIQQLGAGMEQKPLQSLWPEIITGSGESAILAAAETGLPSFPTLAAAAESGLRSFPTLAAFYCVANPIAVENFLRTHTKLLPLLFSAFPRIKFYWGVDTQPALTIVDDPEGGLSVLIVRLSSNMPDAYGALDRFDEEWWLDHIREAKGLLNFSLSSK